MTSRPRFRRALFALLALAPGLFASPRADTADWVRIAEAHRLAEELGAELWSGWEATGFSVLLVESEVEHLIDYPRTPPGFAPAGRSSVLAEEVFARARVFRPDLLATFPAFGLPPTVVIGTSRATGKTSTEWVVTLLHEHFHQLQMGDEAYVEDVDALDLAGGDASGMWQLEYPFPYEAPEVADVFAGLSRQLAAQLREPSSRGRRAFWGEYDAFLAMLEDADRRYLSFQLWQEGVPRYVELRAAELAAERFEASLEFRALEDFEPFEQVADRVRAGIFAELESPDLAGRRRLSFYAFGAGLAWLLDREGEAWRDRYLEEKFALERFAEGR